MFDVRDYRGTGDGATDDTEAIMEAIAAAEALGNGSVVWFPRGRYRISATLSVRKGISLRADGWGDVGPTANPTSESAGTTLVWAGAAAPVVWFKAAAHGDSIHGGGVEGLIIDGSNVATDGIRLSSCKHTRVDGNLTYRTVATGMRIDVDNDALSGFVYVPVHTHRLGDDSAAHGSHGIDLLGSPPPGRAFKGFTNHWFGLLDIEYERGDALRFGSGDTCYVAKYKGSPRTKAATGRDIVFLEGADGFTARKHVIAHVGRGERIVAENGTANRILHMNSEGGRVSIEGTGVLIYDVQDRLHGDIFEGGTRYAMSDGHPVGVGSIVPGPNASRMTVGAPGWPAIDLPAAMDSSLAFFLPTIRDWNDGSISGVRVSCAAGARAISRLSVHLVLEGQTGTMDSARLNSVAATATVKAQLPGRIHTMAHIDVDFAVALRFRRGDWVAMKLTRLGTHAADTSRQDMLVFGVEVRYRSDGPASRGARPADWSITNDQIR